ncbi:MAG: hypothetical protein EOO01_41165, partial [Chitinophagaceae bacterium]
MQITKNDYRRRFITAEDMVHAMVNSGEILGICQCNIRIYKGRLAEAVVDPVIKFASASLKWLNAKPALVVITSTKTYLFKTIRAFEDNAQHSFRTMYRIDNDDMEIKKSTANGSLLLELPGNYLAKL